MFAFPDIVRDSPALRAQLDDQIRLLAQLLQRGCDLVERLSVLNLHTTRQAIDQALDCGRQLAASKDPVQMGTIAMHRLQPAGELMRNYQQQLLGICTDAQTQLVRPAGELLRGAGGPRRAA